jgi:hypothetical protein
METHLVFMAGMIALGVIVVLLGVYYFVKRAKEQARQITMEQELEDMITRQRGLKREVSRSNRLEAGQSGISKKAQLDLVQKGQFLVQSMKQDGHTQPKGILGNISRKGVAQRVRPLEVKDDEPEQGRGSKQKRSKKKKRKTKRSQSKLKSQKTRKRKKRKTKRSKRSKSRGSTPTTSDAESSASGYSQGLDTSMESSMSNLGQSNSSSLQDSADAKKGGMNTNFDIVPSAEKEGASTPESKPKEKGPKKTQSKDAPTTPTNWTPKSKQLAEYKRIFGAVDSSNSKVVEGKQAAKFLKSSGVEKKLLRTIWQMADRKNKGSLDETEFYTCLGLVALAQNGLEVSLASLENHRENMDLPTFAAEKKEKV